MQQKIRVGVLFGGKSAEHQISMQSAKSVITHLDRGKYDVVPIGIDTQGEWYSFDSTPFLTAANQGKWPTFNRQDPLFPLQQISPSKACLPFAPTALKEMTDVMFIVLHGPNGEDGTIQGVLELAGVPYVGPGVLGSAICMDKIMMKNQLEMSGLPTVGYRSFHQSDTIDLAQIGQHLKFPLFVKPANMGSSIGINKSYREEDLKMHIEHAFRYDEYILIEEAVHGREIECAVLGNSMPKASLPGEILFDHPFYSYEAKYIDTETVRFALPAPLDMDIQQDIQRLAVLAFKALRCEGMARVDFFLDENNKIFINELNTIPGFTEMSLYPKLWEISGVPYVQLLDMLIECAMERFERTRLARATS